jgi:hypothetical protein
MWNYDSHFIVLGPFPIPICVASCKCKCFQFVLVGVLVLVPGWLETKNLWMVCNRSIKRSLQFECRDTFSLLILIHSFFENSPFVSANWDHFHSCSWPRTQDLWAQLRQDHVNVPLSWEQNMYLLAQHCQRLPIILWCLGVGCQPTVCVESTKEDGILLTP